MVINHLLTGMILQVGSGNPKALKVLFISNELKPKTNQRATVCSTWAVMAQKFIKSLFQVEMGFETAVGLLGVVQLITYTPKV